MASKPPFLIVLLPSSIQRIIAIVVFALLAEVAAMLTILSSTYMQMGATSTLFPTIPFKACVPFNIPSYFFAFWLPPLGYEFIVFVLAASKGYQTMRLVFNQFTFKTTGSRLIEVMIRDSLWYFLLIFVCDMVCSLIWLKGPDSLLQAVAGFGLVIPSVAGSHLLLNLRDAYYRPTTTFVTNNTTNRHQRMTTATIGGSNVSNQDQRDRDRDRDRRQAQSYDLTTFFAHSRDESGTGGGVDDAGFDTTLEGGETARSTMDMEEGTKMTPTTSTTGTAVQPSTPQKERVAKLGGTRKGEGYELNSLP
ncbi:hypothetical protein FRC17_009525 [Serendipita sp. 399]|nr:hypothetical protein FRC17_009525 [Serendipita sp. 399]